MNLLDKYREKRAEKRRILEAKEKYEKDKTEYIRLQEQKGGMPIKKEFPQLFDYKDAAGSVDGHYFLQDIYAAEVISESGVKKHYDIGSRIDGFIAHLLANSNIDELVMLDIRPFPYKIPKLSFVQTNATSLDNIEDNSIESISSLHAIEHFGLGRYGDPIDPMACYKAMKAIQRVTKKKGYIYIGVPVTMSDECHFNAHRIFCPDTIVDQFDECSLHKLAFILPKITIKEYEGEKARSCIRNREYILGEYDCAVFVFQKN